MKRVLVTGSSRGIGQAIAVAVGAAGYDVTVHYNSSQTGAEETLKTITSAGGAGSLLKFDISDRDGCRQVLEKDVEDKGPFYGVVCNAGLTRDNAFPMLSGEDWDKVIRTNLDGFFNVLNPLITPMICGRKGGRVITLSSTSGIMGNRGQTNYSAAKAGIIGATKALALEVAKRKITVNCVAPGLIETDMLKEMDSSVREMVLKSIPMQRFGNSDEVAGLVKFLLSDEAAYITRQVICVNGGLM